MSNRRDRQQEEVRGQDSRALQPRRKMGDYGDGTTAMGLFLEANDMCKFAPLFLKHEYDMGALKASTREDLKELGLPLGAVLKIMKKLKAKAKEEAESAMPAVVSPPATPVRPPFAAETPLGPEPEPELENFSPDQLIMGTGSTRIAINGVALVDTGLKVTATEFQLPGSPAPRDDTSESRLLNPSGLWLVAPPPPSTSSTWGTAETGQAPTPISSAVPTDMQVPMLPVMHHNLPLPPTMSPPSPMMAPTPTLGAMPAIWGPSLDTVSQPSPGYGQPSVPSIDVAGFPPHGGDYAPNSSPQYNVMAPMAPVLPSALDKGYLNIQWDGPPVLGSGDANLLEDYITVATEKMCDQSEAGFGTAQERQAWVGLHESIMMAKVSSILHHHPAASSNPDWASVRGLVAENLS